ncbi:hematopoietic progenitor cell antigen CD34 isoform X2 [Gouania willdenowi]|uniref:hematopoietic progenitor cell antigen CD34 isoform X2 n=1 Tax=Gouania willdenowi TaxID=441366 RepID=UPI001054719E|nr:hematopoietic progenitor cell antigen CD34 isoform X2 [Gouania willdenowi]
MAASSALRKEKPGQMVAIALLLVISLLNTRVQAQDDTEVVTGTAAPVVAAETYIRGDMIVEETEAAEPMEQTTASSTMEAIDSDERTAAALEGATDHGDVFTFKVYTIIPDFEEETTQAPIRHRGDGPNNKPMPSVPRDDVVCVTKEAVQDKNAVNLKLKESSNCEETKVKIESVLQELCGEDCKLEIYQEDGSDEILVSGKYVEADVPGMANKFNNDNIKDKTDVQEAVPHWGKNSKLVLVSLLLAGLLLAALLVAGFYFKTHRKNSKGVRLAETYQVDEENQANTLVSVAPLPQEPMDKPIINGESPPENGTNTSSATNGHSASQTPVADTEM